MSDHTGGQTPVTIEPGEDTRKAYIGAHSEISFDPELCQHAGECVKGSPAVFDTKRRPWIDPDGDTPAHIAEVIARCPSGALRYAQVGA